MLSLCNRWLSSNLNCESVGAVRMLVEELIIVITITTIIE
jgi:hypothetical protein